MQPCFRDDQRGFTLPEVLITVALLGILLSIAVPSWNSYTESRRVVAAQNQLISDLRLASTQAQNRLIEMEVRLTSGSDTYQMVNTEGGDPSLTRTLPEGTVVGSTETIVFNARGAAGSPPEGEPNQTYTVTVQAEDGDHPLNVEILGATARVKAA